MSIIQPVEQPTKHPSFETNHAEKNGFSQHGSSLSGSETETVTCAVCEAVYVPSQAHPHLRHAPSVVLESALSSMCHFCFRCRRAACPECWDSVHGLCGTCVEEVELTFRVEAALLEGLMFPPVRMNQAEQDGQEGQEEKYSVPLLVCVHPGRFQKVARVGARPTPTMDEPAPEADSLSMVGVGPAPTLGYGGQPQGIAPTDGGRGGPSLAEEEEEEDDSLLNLLGRIFRVGERIVTIILLVVLLAVVALIVLAEVSVGANAQILRFLHVDIRHEIAYLFSLIQQLRW